MHVPASPLFGSAKYIIEVNFTKVKIPGSTFSRLRGAISRWAGKSGDLIAFESCINWELRNMQKMNVREATDCYRVETIYDVPARVEVTHIASGQAIAIINQIKTTQDEG